MARTRLGANVARNRRSKKKHAAGKRKKPVAPNGGLSVRSKRLNGRRIWSGKNAGNCVLNVQQLKARLKDAAPPAMSDAKATNLVKVRTRSGTGVEKLAALRERQRAS